MAIAADRLLAKRMSRSQVGSGTTISARTRRIASPASAPPSFENGNDERNDRAEAGVMALCTQSEFVLREHCKSSEASRVGWGPRKTTLLHFASLRRPPLTPSSSWTPSTPARGGEARASPKRHERAE